MRSTLFSPIRLGPLELPNRIVVSPMCQYSADDGCANPVWHRQHWAQLGMSGAGLVVVEATGVERIGRITHGCLGLYSDRNEAALARVLAPARKAAVGGRPAAERGRGRLADRGAVRHPLPRRWTSAVRPGRAGSQARALRVPA